MKLAIDLDMSQVLESGDPVLLAITVAQTKGQTVLASVLEIDDTNLRWIDGEARPVNGSGRMPSAAC